MFFVLFCFFFPFIINGHFLNLFGGKIRRKLEKSDKERNEKIKIKILSLAGDKRGKSILIKQKSKEKKPPKSKLP